MNRLLFAVLALLAPVSALAGPAQSGPPGIAAGSMDPAETSPQFLQVTEPLPLQFPTDHGQHPGYSTEWWYFTGHLAAAGGEQFGFELTFFRIGVRPPAAESLPRSAWRTDSIYLAHLALTDDSGKFLPSAYGSPGEGGRFFSADLRSRGSLGEAGSAEDRLAVHLKGLSAEEEQGMIIRLKSDHPLVSFDLPLISTKPPALQGDKGFSRKGPQPGQASIYYSLTRLESRCESGCSLTAGGKKIPLVSAEAWMDHEITSNKLGGEALGWDWFAVALDDRSELMVYQLRNKQGGKTPFSSGSIIAADGEVTHLNADDFSIAETGKWRSPKSGITYPSGWRVSVPKAGLNLKIDPTVRAQELLTPGSTGVTYWEGRCLVSDGGERPIGKAYVELVGYN